MSSIIKNVSMKISNSVVGVGVYYGFMTTFGLGTVFFLLSRVCIREEEKEKKAASITGFLLGHFVVFGSVFYMPLHLILGNAHIILTLITLYLCFAFWFKDFLDYGSTTGNTLSNWNVAALQIIWQVTNRLVLPSPTLARLGYVYMFRFNNKTLFLRFNTKMVFLISWFVGWLIGHILFLKIIELVVVWIHQNYSKFTASIGKFLVGKEERWNRVLEQRWNFYRPLVPSVLFCVFFLYYLDKSPAIIFTKRVKERLTPQDGSELADEQLEQEEDPSSYPNRDPNQEKEIKQEQEDEEDPLNKDPNQETEIKQKQEGVESVPRKSRFRRAVSSVYNKLYNDVSKWTIIDIAILGTCAFLVWVAK